MSDPCSSPPRPGLLVTDFDGTMTRRDFYQVFRQRYLPDNAPDFWAEYRAGRMTHFEALRSIFATAAPGAAALLDLTTAMELEPELASALAALRSAGWDVAVVSAGCSWYIEHLFTTAGVTLELHANPGRIENGRLIMELPVESPFFSAATGIDKAAVVLAAREAGRLVAFAGDGFPDLPAALLVPDPLRFARGDLAIALAARAIPFRPFTRWNDVARVVRAVPPRLTR